MRGNFRWIAECSWGVKCLVSQRKSIGGILLEWKFNARVVAGKVVGGFAPDIPRIIIVGSRLLFRDDYFVG